jgi:hypothetical protein
MSRPAICIVALVIGRLGLAAETGGSDFFDPARELVACDSHLFCEQGALSCLCSPEGRTVRITVDLDADGQADSVTEYTLDEHGRVTVRAVDDGADGVPDYVVWRTLREDGQVATEDHDTDGDGTVDQRGSYSYDAMGYLQLVEDDYGLDGVVDVVTAVRYTLDARGLPIRRELDMLGDGLIEGRLVWEWDEQERLVGAGWDNDGDGVPGPSVRYEYGDDGRWVAAHHDGDGDGAVDESCRFDPPCAPCLPRMEPWMCEQCRETCTAAAPGPPTP